MSSSSRDSRIAAARSSAMRAVNRDQVRAALKAAGASRIDDSAVEAASAIVAENLAELSASAASASRDRRESSLSAASVAVGATRSARSRSSESSSSSSV